MTLVPSQPTPAPSRRRLLTGLAAAALALPAALRAQGRITLKVSHFVAPTHRLQSDLLLPWAKDIETRTQGAVTVQISAANSALGQAQNQLDQCLNGVVDVAYGLCGLPRGRMARSMLIELPFMAATAEAGSRTLWNLYPRLLGDDYKGLKPLLLMTHNAGGLHTRGKVEHPADLRGLRIRTPSPTVSLLLSALGAIPVGMPPTQLYENLDKGVIDGAATTWDAVHSFRLDEVVRHHLDARFFTAAFWFGINQRRFDALPADVRAAIEAASGEALLKRVQPMWDSWDDGGRAAARARGSQVLLPDAALQAEWRNAAAPLLDGALAEFQKEGVANAREIHGAMLREIARLSKG
ncbi:TRAP transporter substrate-binding protein [Rubrivivax sp. A210]|uniref:TRAP transporter substrate-binding protein n=1 Tax=Rubrivivax sp. A210 TaxID=2772301 RepID=UPI00191905D6|nr:TRAP transporter substrate-binding protein [Rubrivivax sp. A210]